MKRLLVTLIVGLSLVASQAHAADSNNPTGSLNLVTSPLPLNIAAKPGASVSVDIKVKNAGNAPEQLKATVLKFGAYGDDGSPRLLDPTPQDAFIKWASISPSTFTAQPNVWNTAKLTISPPKTAAFGYYYAIVFSRANEAISQNQANLKGAVATLVLFEAKVPGAKRQVDVTEYTADKKIHEFLPATFTVRLRNSGNVHVAPRGNIFIHKGKKTIDTLEVNLSQGNILPNSYRVFTAEWANGWPERAIKSNGDKVVLDKNDKPTRALSWKNFSPGKIRIGHYTAQMVLAYDDGSRDVPIEASLGFWVIPWRMILAALLVGGLALFGLYTSVKSALRKVRRKRR